MRSDRQFDAVVIGGGQAGLAVGYHLARQGRDFAILDERDRAGDAWRTRWDGLRLFTSGRLNGLPGMPFPGDPHGFPTKDEVADYLEEYVARFELPLRTGVRVSDVRAWTAVASCSALQSKVEGATNQRVAQIDAAVEAMSK